MKKLLTLAAALCGFASVASAQLTPGDIAIIGVGTDNTYESFSWVTLVDLSPGTTINFSDNGIYNGSWRDNEGAVSYTVSSFAAAGTVFTYNTSDYTEFNAGFSLADTGDQVIAYQTSGSTDTFLYAVNLDSNAFVSGDDSNHTEVPSGLTNGVNAVAVGRTIDYEYDNAYYNGTITGTASALLASISNASNWVGDNSNYNPISTSFNVTAVPEPSTYALIFGSLAALGFIYRRCKQAK